MSIAESYKDVVLQLNQLKSNIKKISPNHSKFLMNVKSMEEKINTAVSNYSSDKITLEEYINVTNSIVVEMTDIVDFLLNNFNVL